MIDLDVRALIVWLRFEVECEDFDRQLPGFWWRGDPSSDEWLPHDMGLSRRYAYEKRRDAEAELRRLEIPRELSARAKAYAGSLSTKRAKRELDALLATFPEYGRIPEAPSLKG